MLRGFISHVEIYVSDLERSESFWGWFLMHLGYVPYQNWEQGRSWQLGPLYFVIVQVEDEFRQNTYHRKNVGLNHIAFHAEDNEDVDRMTKLLEEKGITILYKDRHPHAASKNSYTVFFEDPDRIKVEFVAINPGRLHFQE